MRIAILTFTLLLSSVCFAKGDAATNSASQAPGNPKTADYKPDVNGCIMGCGIVLRPMTLIDQCEAACRKAFLKVGQACPHMVGKSLTKCMYEVGQKEGQALQQSAEAKTGGDAGAVKEN